MNNLEKYILENRDELDRMEQVPDEAMWQKIRANSIQQKPPTRTGVNWKILSIAALVLALAGWGLLFFKKTKPVPPAAQPPQKEVMVAEQNKATPQPEPQIAEQKTLPPTTSPAIVQAEKTNQPAKRPSKKRTLEKARTAPVSVEPNISEQEQRWKQLVSQKKQEIGFDHIDRAAYAELLKELDELEITVEQARKDFEGMPQNERLVETLTRYYELKIKILEQISYEINKQEYHEALEKRI